MADNSSQSTQQETPPRREYPKTWGVEAMVGLVGGVAGLVVALNGLSETVQIVIGASVAVTILAAAAKFIIFRRGR